MQNTAHTKESQEAPVNIRADELRAAWHLRRAAVFLRNVGGIWETLARDCESDAGILETEQVIDEGAQ